MTDTDPTVMFTAPTTAILLHPDSGISADRSSLPDDSLATNSAPLPKKDAPPVVVRNHPSLGLDQPVTKHLGYFLYAPGRPLPLLIGHAHARLVVRVPRPWLTYKNPSVQQRRLWGTDIYTDDSDVVAALIHSGHYMPPSPHPLLQSHHTFLAANGDGDPTSESHSRHSSTDMRRRLISDRFPDHDLAVTLRALPKLRQYTGTVRACFRSRDWLGEHDGGSFIVESVTELKPGEARLRGSLFGRKARIREFCEARRRAMMAL